MSKARLWIASLICQWDRLVLQIDVQVCFIAAFFYSSKKDVATKMDYSGSTKDINKNSKAHCLSLFFSYHRRSVYTAGSILHETLHT